MSKMLQTKLIPLIYLLFILLMSGGTGAVASDVDINELIQNADTSEDHTNIAIYYEQQAALMESKVRQHETMAKSYKRTSKRKARPQHCTNLAEKFMEAAEEYKALAAEHREIAKEMQ